MTAAVVGGTLALAFGAVRLVQWNSPSSRIKRRLLRAPHLLIEDYPHGGRNRIMGYVVADEQRLETPLTGRPCVAYQVVVRQLRRSERSTHWKVLARIERGVPFVVRDATGRAFVDPEGAEMAIGDEDRSLTFEHDEREIRHRMFVERARAAGEWWPDREGLNYIECALEIDTLVSVLGTGAQSHDDEPPPGAYGTGYRSELPTKLEIRGSADQPLCLSNDPETIRV